MKIRLFLSLLGFACLLSTAKSDCDLSGRAQDVEFPNIAKYVADSYIMGVEYSVPGARQTDYYTEYYEIEFARGRVDSHIAGENQQLIYFSETTEFWVLKNNKCTLLNETLTPDIFKSAQTDWLHYTAGKEQPTTIGPSAMLKTAYDEWKKPKDKRRMAYMGTSNTTIRGEKAVFWRRCTFGDDYTDYFFADQSEENPFDTDVFDRMVTPLRVAFHGVGAMEKALSEQYYDIISFQHFIPAGVEPFQLPKGKNCRRTAGVDGPALPDFSSNNIFLSAEVVYRKYSINGRELLSSYYSTLMFGLDKQIEHLAYYYSSWNTTKPDKDHDEPFVNAPHYVIYDMKHQYTYKINYETAKCEVSRVKEFVPQYKLPENGGSIALTDPYVLLPNNELQYLTSGKDRGLDVNIFEAELEGYLLDKSTVIPRAIVSHSYLKSNEKLENTVEVKNAPTQMELHFFRKDDIEEVLTFNIFGFTTRLPRQYLFDVTRCFKNDDDYSYLTIGFEVEPRYVSQVKNKLPEIEENVLSDITLKSELNPVRIPSIMTDMKDDYVYVTMLILEKPTIQLDFPDSEEGKSVVVSSPDDTQGISNFPTCAANCLESRFDCWGFSLCGGTCYFGSETNTKVEEKKGCTLYKKYNGTYIASKAVQIQNIIREVETKQFNTMVTLDNDERITLTATFAQETDPAEDDSLFEKMGNLLNPRMDIMKAATKLKRGTKVKNMGKLRYDECQRLCLDFKECETVSYCLINSDCVLSEKYESDLTKDDMQEDQLCILLKRKYTDNFDRTPGVFVTASGGTVKDLPKVEDCARACLKEDKFKCLSFDHCAGDDKKGCTLYSVHFLDPKARKQVANKNPRCGHYSRKFSNDFKKKNENRVLGSKVPPIMNLTLEECAKTCIDYGDGTCFGYDFCQDKTMFSTSCILIDSDPSRLKSTYSPICTNYVRAGQEYAPRPYTNSYAGGIGFVCFIVGGVLGAIAVFGIAYIRVNRGG